MKILASVMKLNKKMNHINKRYFRLDQQIARHFVHYSESLYHPPILLCNSNN